MIAQLSFVEASTYLGMLCLLGRAIGHHIEARRLQTPARKMIAELDAAADHMRRGGTAYQAIMTGCDAASGTTLAGVFQEAHRYGGLAVIREKVDSAIDAQFGSLHGRCEHSELVGPRWALGATVLGIALTMAVKGEGGMLASGNYIALALINTGIGIIIANLEQTTLSLWLTPLTDKLRAASIALLIETNCARS